MSKISPEPIARGVCAACGGPVAVKKNSGGRAYYRCDNDNFFKLLDRRAHV